MNAPRNTILAIDDNPENLLVLGSALDGDFQCLLASSGTQGLALALQSPPDLILLDIMMPDVDGFETCRRFKAEPKLQDIPIIFLTALKEMETEIGGLALGAADYITKPINVALVKQRVCNILRLTQLTRQLKVSEERLRLVMEATGEGLWDWHLPTNQVVHNTAWCKILGLDYSHLTHPQDHFYDRVHPEDAAGVRQKMEVSLEDGTPYSSEHRVMNAQNQYVWVADNGQVVERDAVGAPVRMLGSMKDISERKRQEEEIHQLAFFDTLTGLANRRLLLDRLQQSILRNTRSAMYGVVLFLDMDRFKSLNDTHGHAKGDKLLVQIAARLKETLRQQDTASRIGGDEFIVILESIADQPQVALRNASLVAQKILERLNQPYTLDHTLTYHSTPSIGMALFAGQPDSNDSIIQRADAAMYQAKAQGRNCICIAP